MSRDIQSGIEKLTTVLATRQEEESTSQWRSIRNKIDSLLLSTHVLKTDEARRLCLTLDHMTMEERKAHITTYWGAAALAKIFPLLQQLESIELSIAKMKPI